MGVEANVRPCAAARRGAMVEYSGMRLWFDEDRPIVLWDD
jgi:hypothetical protein